MIPPVIHQIWLGSDQPPASVLESVQSWRDHAPQFTHRLWLAAELAERFGRVAGYYSAQSEYYRVKILDAEGGVYVDADTLAQPGAGDALAEIVPRAKLMAGTFDGANRYDTNPIGAEAGLPGFGELSMGYSRFYRVWSEYLRGRTTGFVSLPGGVWNAKQAGEGVLVIHNRRTLSPRIPKPHQRIVLNTRGKKEAYRRAEVKRMAEGPPVFDRVAMVGQVPEGDAVEVGTHRGLYAAQVLQRISGTLTCVDTYTAPMPDSIDRDADRRKAQRLLQPYGDRAVFLPMESITAAEQFAEESLALVYIDADHTAAAVRGDISAWWPKVQPGGMMAGHDLTGPWGDQVRPEVERFCLDHGLAYEQTDDSPASWFIRKPE